MPKKKTTTKKNTMKKLLGLVDPSKLGRGAFPNKMTTRTARKKTKKK